MSEEVSGLVRGSFPGEDWSWSGRLLESLSSGITIADARTPELPLIYANPAFERMTGYALEEIRGRNCRFLQGAGTDREDLERLRRALGADGESRTVLRNYRKDGTAFWNEMYLSPVRDAEGSVTHFMGIHNDVTVRVELEAKLAHMAHYDALTGLANRALLMDRIEQGLLRAKRSHRLVAVLFFDLDNFKRINDLYGHEAGDSVLRGVADRLRSKTRKYETVARLGGDEFVVVIEELATESEGLEIMQRLLEYLGQPMSISGEELRASASVGMGLSPRDGMTPMELLRAADVAMYAAKDRARERGPARLEVEALSEV